MKDEREPTTAGEKIAILHRDLIGGIPFSNLCDEHHVNPSFYRWLKQFLENTAGFGPAWRTGRSRRAADRLARGQAEETGREFG